MRDFLRENWKIAAAFAAGAFLLSFLVGLVARNPFGVVILRALLLAVVFAGLGAGLRFAVAKYLPDLVQPGATTAAGDKADREEGRGTRVDIVLPEENPIRRQQYRANAREARQGASEGGRTPAAAASAAGKTADAPDTLLEDDSALQAAEEAEALGDLADEMAEELPLAASDQGISEDTSEDAGVQESAARGGGGIDREGTSTASGSALGTSGSDEDLDSLPDISNLEVAADQETAAPRARLNKRTGRETPEDAMRSAVSGQDPATIARAIRTVLKRDEKG